ncbi:MAG: TolC family protein [Bacteroidota bacterium]
MKNQTLAFLFCVFGFLGFAQNPKNDTLLFPDFFAIVKKNHPVVKMANLQPLRGSTNVMQAKGGFDPQSYSYLYNKFFGGKEYYNYLDAGVKAQTRLFGLEFQAGFESSRGDFISSDMITPSEGLWMAGFSLPVLQGLIIDKQRAALREAKIYKEATKADQKRIINDLLLQAGTLYWEWAAVNNQLEVYADAIKFSEDRLAGLRQAFLLGDRPAIDTVETLIQLQNFSYSYNQTQLLLIQKTYELSVFFWDDKNNPIFLPETIKAPNFQAQIFSSFLTKDSLRLALDSFAKSHPELQLYNYKLKQLDIEKKLKLEKLKPKLNLRYNFLSYPSGNQPPGNFSTDNYKWGAEFGMPMFLRNERADVKLTRIKIMETELNNQLKQKEIAAKIISGFRKCEFLIDQIELMKKTVENYKRMLNAEKTNFDAGESSVFLVNSRELALVQAELKLIDSESKFRQAVISFFHSAGTLWTHEKF